MTQADDRVLETLEESELVLSPKVLAVNTDYSRHYVSERLSKLLKADLVKKQDDGLYRITEKGRSYLSGEIGSENLELPD